MSSIIVKDVYIFQNHTYSVTKQLQAIVLISIDDYQPHHLGRFCKPRVLYQNVDLSKETALPSRDWSITHPKGGMRNDAIDPITNELFHLNWGREWPRDHQEWVSDLKREGRM